MLRKALHHKDASQRVVAAIFAAGMAAMVAVSLGVQIYMTFVSMPETADLQRAALADRKVAYHWMSENLPQGTAVFSYDDPLLYLYGGHRGNYRAMMPRWWYADDHAQMVNAYRDIAAYCKSRGLDYMYFTTEDLSRETGEPDRKAIEALVRSDRSLKPIYTAGIGTVYQVSP